ncbi:hypothetical protein R1T16_06270 [Flavobacterium sp. DG1-102-2]|uniref:hypothetical protein n=1 Tax=Flavobacterium sp. DG1-102-2 TaxID=3081663 RepID=UPI002949EA8E|nr:hypothetical protein [Flavobacterium sp. DG1-102-2]MDV6168022.1 hypothetical protein [Flavobacterium sp. DG1-102-2]
MELQTIERLLDKYFDGETTIAEEKDLKLYFSSPGVAPQLEQYRPLFGYLSSQEEQRFDKPLPLKTPKRYGAWLSVAASVALLGGMLTLYNSQQPSQTDDLGTFSSPEEAYQETQKALNMLSNNVNVGVGSVHYVAKEYDKSTKVIFKESQSKKVKSKK